MFERVSVVAVAVVTVNVRVTTSESLCTGLNVPRSICSRPLLAVCESSCSNALPVVEKPTKLRTAGLYVIVAWIASVSMIGRMRRARLNWFPAPTVCWRGVRYTEE